MARVPKWQQRHDKKKEIFNRLAEFEQAINAVAFYSTESTKIVDKIHQEYDEAKQQLIFAIEELSRI